MATENITDDKIEVENQNEGKLYENGNEIQHKIPQLVENQNNKHEHKTGGKCSTTDEINPSQIVNTNESGDFKRHEETQFNYLSDLDQLIISDESVPRISTEPAEYYFESDHLALRGNADYTILLRTIALLNAQKIRASKDIDRLSAAKNEALKNPFEFVEKVKKGVDLKLPSPLKIATVPEINLKKYGVDIPKGFLHPSQETGDLNKEQDRNISDQSATDKTADVNKKYFWTSAEQRRLEELLETYPPEGVEMRRFAKIAKAMGNRTTKQVASRLQKYFLKLHRAGLPIPGRAPRMRGIVKNRNKNINGFTRIGLMRPSTYFPSFEITTSMEESLNDEDSHYMMPHWNDVKPESSTPAATIKEETITKTGGSELENNDGEISNDQAMLLLLKRVQQDKMKQGAGPLGVHEGFKCDFCQEEPIIGTRWHCTICSVSIDFCSDCIVAQLDDPGRTHPLSHKIIALESPSETRSPKASKGKTLPEFQSYNENSNDGSTSSLYNDNDDSESKLDDQELRSSYDKESIMTAGAIYDLPGTSSSNHREYIVSNKDGTSDRVLQESIIDTGYGSYEKHIKPDNNNDNDEIVPAKDDTLKFEEECEDDFDLNEFYDNDYLPHNFFPSNRVNYNYMDPNYSVE